MVQLFEWKWSDIAAECERFLGPNGYGAVEVSPPNEHVLINEPFRPWWQRYQPISYKLISRSGNEQEFIEMVQRCNNAGVRIYVDAVISFFCPTPGNGTAGSYYDPVKKYYPSIPYGPDDFNDKKCKSLSGLIENNDDIEQVRNCKLLGLHDLDTSKEEVREKVSAYLNHLIEIGVAGFRLDGVKYIWPNDLESIYLKLNNVTKSIFGFNKRPFIYQDINDVNDNVIKSTDYTHLARVTEFKYAINLKEVVSKKTNRTMSELKNLEKLWSLVPDEDSLIFINNHNTQRGNDGIDPVITYKNPREYKIATAFMLAWPYGFAKVMSSYDFNDISIGPPADDYGNTRNVTITKNDGCGNGWACEHRWRQIVQMVKFRNLSIGYGVENWWDNKRNQIAFSRGNISFIAINNDIYDMNAELKTGLSPGKYCDIISGVKKNSLCTGLIITIDQNGTTRINISKEDQNPIIAINIESKL
uniref:Alpha-amylase n=1 Tax=Brachionus rotundiformis TaxID=96890 RepID=A0A8K1XFR8_9BILA|nr:AMY1 [Brachionus rotundiformis]